MTLGTRERGRGVSRSRLAPAVALTGLLVLAAAGTALAFWGTPSTVVSGSGIGLDPNLDRQIATDGNWVYAVWTDTTANRVIHFARSSDNGATWAEPASFTNLAAATYRNQAWSPSIAAVDGRVYIVWNLANNTTVTQYGGRIYAWTATANGGTSAANPVSLYNSNTNADRYWTGAAADDEAGTPRAYAFYRQNGTGVRVQIATTGGTTWGNTTTVLNNATGVTGFGRVGAASPLGAALLWKPAAAAGVLNVSTNGGTVWVGGATGWALPSASSTQSLYATATTGAVGVQRAYADATGVWVQRWTGTTTWAAAVKVSDTAYDARTAADVSLSGVGTRMLAVWSYAGTPAATMFSRMTTDAAAWLPIQALPVSAGAYYLVSASTATDDHVLYSSATTPAAIFHIGSTVDTTPPGVPTGLAADTVLSSTAHLTWNPSVDPAPASGVAYYEVYRDGSRIATTTSISYSASGLAPSTTYGFQVAAVDADGNSSARCASLPVTTLPAGLSMTMLTTSTVDFGSVNVGSTYTAAVKPVIQVTSDKPWDYSSTQTSITAGAATFPFPAFLTDTGTVAFAMGQPAGVTVDTRTFSLDVSSGAAYTIPANTPMKASVMYTAVQE